MGTCHSNAASVVQMKVAIPCKGNKVVKNKFVRETPAEGVKVGSYFASSVASSLQSGDGAAGALLRTCVVLRGGEEEIEVEPADEVLEYVKMGISKVIFYVEAAEVEASSASTRQIADVLQRQRVQELPQWSHAGRPALTLLYAAIRRRLEAEKLGFSGAMDLKAGNDWMLMLADVLYELSPFHHKFQLRGHPIPKMFKFSEGANDYRKKRKSEPLLTQDVIEQVCTTEKIYYAHISPLL